MLSLHIPLIALSLLCGLVLAGGSNSFIWTNQGKLEYTILYVENSNCPPLGTIDHVLPGQTVTQDSHILMSDCGGGAQWSGRAYAIPGHWEFDPTNPIELNFYLNIGKLTNAVLAEVAFVQYAGQTFYDTSRVDMICSPLNAGVKWMYPNNNTAIEKQSGCHSMESCWNMYVWDHNDHMQLSDASSEIVVVIGEDDTPCGADGMECCTDPNGCVASYQNVPSAVPCNTLSGSAYIYSGTGYNGIAGGFSGSFSLGIALSTSIKGPTTATASATSQASGGMKNVSPPIPYSTKATGAGGSGFGTGSSSTSTSQPITTTTPPPIVIETDWVTVTEFQTVWNKRMLKGREAGHLAGPHHKRRPRDWRLQHDKIVHG